MLRILENRIFARLFAAQVVALLGTGLLTVALALLAYDLAGAKAGTVLGTALTIKMVAYVGLSPVIAAAVSNLPRKAVLIAADLVRAAAALCLPFIDAVWQIYVVIFVLQTASASFTPAFQAVIPDVFEKEEDYTRALSLSRMAYDIENLISPALAGLLLLLVSFHTLFFGTVLGFLGSALLVWGTGVPPKAADTKARPFAERVTRGVRIYLATPRLRGLLAVTFTAAAVGAFVLVNTVVLVRDGFGRSEADLALAMAFFGGGSMLAALGLPSLLDRVQDRPVILAGSLATAGIGLVVGLALAAGQGLGWPVFLGLWALLGLAYSVTLTPSGRLLRRSAHAEDRPAIFTAQFALSHACWLVTYPAAGWLGASLGLGATLMLLAGAGMIAALAAGRLWPASGADLAHDHPDLPPDHPHLREHGRAGHHHAYVIDDQHPRWPGA